MTSLTLSPATADGTVGVPITFTATALDNGTPVQNVVLIFKVENNKSATRVATNASGQATFLYTPTTLPAKVKVCVADNQKSSGSTTCDDDLPTDFSVVASSASPPPTVSIADATVTEGDSGTTPAAFVVTLSASSAAPVTVSYATANGSAIAGSDYTARTGTVTFDPGAISATISVDVLGDTVEEPNETFAVNLTNPSGVSIADGAATGTINDDDSVAVLPTVSIADATVTEGDSGTTPAAFVVTLSASSAAPVTVSYATANGSAIGGSDYTARTGTVTFDPGATSATISADVLGDTVEEPNETFAVNLTNPSGASIADGAATGTINDDDSASIPRLGGGRAPQNGEFDNVRPAQREAFFCGAMTTRPVC
ncbi:MAG: Calx-beta domain-containing protein [Sporichthyaceae bacterium]